MCPIYQLELLPTQGKLILSVDPETGAAVTAHVKCVDPNLCDNCGRPLPGHRPNRRLPGIAGKPDSAIIRCRVCKVCAYPV